MQGDDRALDIIFQISMFKVLIWQSLSRPQCYIRPCTRNERAEGAEAAAPSDLNLPQAGPTRVEVTQMLLPPRVVVLLGLLAVLPSASAFFSSFTTASSHRAPLNQVLSPIRRSSAAAASGETHQASELVGKERLKRFLEDASFLGPVRFVTMNDGGILEAVGSFEGVRYKELPKGEYATFASDDKTFECHINLDAVASVVMVQSKAKHGDYDNYITRFLDKDGKVLVSSMLHKPVGEDQYEEDAVAWWEKLRAIFGEKQQISSNNSN